MSSEPVLVDEPAPHVRRVTLNRPEKRNALNHDLRGGILRALEEGDADPDVHVQIVRGAGKSFSSGYDLGGGNEGQEFPWYTPGGDGHWPRHVTAGWMRIWELGKPVIAQVHGYCLAGGSELMSACDLAYVADDAQIGYPPVRLMSPPDNQYFAWMVGMRNAMEFMLTGDSVSGVEAVQMGLANRSFPLDQLDDAVLDKADRIARIPSDLQQLNKRTVHRAMEIMGMRAAIRAGTEIQALAFHQPSARAHLKEVAQDHKAALSKRDGQFADNRGREGGGSSSD